MVVYLPANTEEGKLIPLQFFIKNKLRIESCVYCKYFHFSRKIYNKLKEIVHKSNLLQRNCLINELQDQK